MVENRQLQSMVNSEVMTGARLEYATSESAIISRGKKVSHVLHLIVSILIGPWSIVWVIFEFTGGVKREQIRVDEQGNVFRTEAPDSGNSTGWKIASVVVLVLWLVLAFVALG